MPRGPAYYQQRARFYARRAGIPEQVFLRQLKMEAGFRTNATSPAGARGIAQIMPFHDVRPDMPGHQRSGINPEWDLAWAAQHNAQNLKKYGNVRDMLSVYNSGRPWARGRNISETRNYVSKILGGSSGASMQVPRNDGSTAFQAEPNAAGSSPRESVSKFLAASLASYARTGQTLGPMDLYTMNRMEQADVPDEGEPTPITERGSVGRAGTFQGGGFRIVEAMKQAKRMGLSIRENPMYDKVDPVHTGSSHHYRTYKGTRVGQAADISGDPRRMAAFFNWSKKRYGRGITELIYDPIGSVFDGNFKRGKYGGHGGHVHIAFGSR